MLYISPLTLISLIFSVIALTMSIMNIVYRNYYRVKFDEDDDEFEDEDDENEIEDEETSTSIKETPI